MVGSNREGILHVGEIELAEDSVERKLQCGKMVYLPLGP